MGTQTARSRHTTWTASAERAMNPIQSRRLGTHLQQAVSKHTDASLPDINELAAHQAINALDTAKAAGPLSYNATRIHTAKLLGLAVKSEWQADFKPEPVKPNPFAAPAGIVKSYPTSKDVAVPTKLEVERKTSAQPSDTDRPAVSIPQGNPADYASRDDLATLIRTVTDLTKAIQHLDKANAALTADVHKLALMVADKPKASKPKADKLADLPIVTASNGAHAVTA